MARKIALALALLLLPAFAQVYALGLGNVTTKSALNQPLRAEIELVSPQGVPHDEMRVRLASVDEFARAGLDRPYFLTELTFSVERHRNGVPFVKVGSKNPVREPFLDFLVELNWPAGRVVREYTLLLDPPTFTRERPAPVQAPQASGRSEPLAAAAPAPAPARATGGYSGDSYGPVGRGETLWTIALRTRPNASVSPQRMMLALLRKNPDAFSRQNINTLMAGVVLRVPSEQELAQIADEEALQTTRAQNAEWRQERAPAPPAAMEKPPLAAPEAPAAPAAEAPKTAKAETPAAASAEKPAAEAAAAEEPKAELKILAATETAGEASPAGESAAPTGGEMAPEAAEQPAPSPDALQEKLAITTENVEALQRENQDLRGRFTDLESQVDSMQRLLTLREQELAKLQAEAAKAQADQQKPLSRLFNQPANLLILVLVIAVVWAIIWVAMRRRNQAAMADAGPMPATFAAPAIPPAPQPVALAPEEPRAPAPEREELPADPLAEADVYMAYGRFSQAEEMLRTAVATHPENGNLRLKLLEVYHATGDRGAFEQEAAELYEQVNEEDPLWQKAARMGREIAPEVRMFGGAPAAPAQPESLAVDQEEGDWLTNVRTPEPPPSHEAFEESGPDQHLDAHAEDQGIDFDLEFLKETAPGAAPAEPMEDLETVEFDLDALEAEAKASLAQPDEEGVAEYDLSGVDDDTVRREDLAWKEPPAIDTEPEVQEEAFSADLGEGVLQFEPVSEPGGEEAEQELDELDLLPDLDEVSTKLDLARAYLDMGDGDGAREILEEVLREGNETQQQEARGLLDQLPS